MSWLTAPFEYGFMRQALVAAILCGWSCSLVGVFVVLRRMAFLGGALTHTILPGLVFAALKGFQLFWGALAAGLITALGVGWISDKRTIREDTAIGIVMTAFFALGLLMMSLENNFRSFSGLLFGNVLAVSGNELVLIATVFAIVVLALILFHKEWELATFDAEYGKLIGIKPRLLHYGLLVLAALSVVSAVQVVGALLAAALLITPPATGLLLSRQIPGIMAVAIFTATLSAMVGLYVSYYFAASSGAAIALTSTACFISAKLFRMFRPLD